MDIQHCGEPGRSGAHPDALEHMEKQQLCDAEIAVHRSWRNRRGPLGGCSRQGLTLVHFLAQRKYILWDTLAARIPPGLLDRGTRRGVTKTASVELKCGRV
jgi:hypothetical protein